MLRERLLRTASAEARSSERQLSQGHEPLDELLEAGLEELSNALVGELRNSVDVNLLHKSFHEYLQYGHTCFVFQGCVI